MAETVETAIYRLRVEGQEQLGKLKSELDGVTVSEEKAAGASRTTTQALQNRLARLDPLIKAQQQYAKELEAATRFAQSGVGSDAQRAAQIDLATRRYNEQVAAINKVEQATGKFATQTGLARHELINLSRQAQDVAVSLGSGQGLGTVLLQQGTQIADIFASSRVGLKGALAGIAEGLGKIFTVGRVAFGGVIAGATAAALALTDYLDKQRETERGLIGAGRRSGASAADINQIGSAGASSTGFSVSEARSVALEFAKTGQVHKSVIGEMIQTTKNFAIITGQSGKEAAESLAKSFSDMRGIDALNKQFDFLNARTRQSIEDLFEQGRSSEAAALAHRNLAERLKEVEATLSTSEKGWTALANAISNAWTATGEYIAKAAGLERLSLDDQIKRTQEALAKEKERTFRVFDGDGGAAFVKELEEKLKSLIATKQKLDGGSDFDKLEHAAAQAVGALNPLVGKIRETENALRLLKSAYEQGAVVPGLSEEINLRQQLLDKLNLQKIAQDALLEKYPGMTLEFAKQVEALEQQNRLLKARENGNEASVSAAIAYENAIAAGATQTEAAAIQALTLKNNLLQAASAASNIEIDFKPDLGDDTSASGGSYTGNETFGSKQFQTTSNLGFSLYTATQRLATTQELINSSLSGGINGAISSLQGVTVPGALRTGIAGYSPDINSLRPGFGTQGDITNAVNELFGLKLAQAGNNTQAKEDVYREQLAWLEQQPMTIQNMRSIIDLKRALEDLKDATEANTAATVSLNPLYNGRDALKVGYYKAATGLEGIVGGTGGTDSTPVHMMLTPGEHIKVTPPGQPTNDNSKVVNNYLTINTGSGSTARRSARQAAQGFGQMMAAIS